MKPAAKFDQKTAETTPKSAESMGAWPKTKSAEKSSKEDTSPKVKEPERIRLKLRAEDLKGGQQQKASRRGEETDITPMNSTNSADEHIIPFTKLSTMSIEPTEGNHTTADDKVEEETD